MLDTSETSHIPMERMEEAKDKDTIPGEVGGALLASL